MFTNDIIVNSYIRYYPKEKKYLHHTLLIGKYESIKKNLHDYFENVKILNFDIINHESRGDLLTNNIEYYQQIKQEDFENIPENDEYNFISSAIKSKRNDIYIQKKVMKKHFIDEKSKQNLKNQNIFLSSMEKCAYKKKLNKEYSSCW